VGLCGLLGHFWSADSVRPADRGTVLVPTPGTKPRSAVRITSDSASCWGWKRPVSSVLASMPMGCHRRSTHRVARDVVRSVLATIAENALVCVLDCKPQWLARVKLDQWVRWARRSRLEPFNASRAQSTTTRRSCSSLAWIHPQTWRRAQTPNSPASYGRRTALTPCICPVFGFELNFIPGPIH
jgi:hypothetical protein